MELVDGVWQPPPSFYTCDALPDEWLELLTRFTQSTKSKKSPPKSARSFITESLSPLPSQIQHSLSREGSPVSRHSFGSGSASSHVSSPARDSPTSTFEVPPAESHLRNEFGVSAQLENDEENSLLYGSDDDFESEDEDEIQSDTSQQTMPAVENEDRYWAIKVTIENIQDTHPVEGDAWFVKYSILGQTCATAAVSSSSAVMPVSFNAVHRVQIKGDEEALRAWLRDAVVDFEICSELEDVCHRGVSIELEDLFESTELVGSFDVLTKSHGGDEGSFEGEQLLLSIHLEDLSSEARRLSGVGLEQLRALAFSTEEVAPGLQTVMKQVGPTPALAVQLTELRSHAWGGDNLSGPTKHTISGEEFEDRPSERNVDLIRSAKHF